MPPAGTLLREKYNWDGIICTDYAILTTMPWGMVDATMAERVMKTIEAGTDRIENFNNAEDILAGWAAYVEAHGQEEADQRLYDSVRRLARSFIQLGLFENAYLSKAEAEANVGSPDKVEAGYEAMQRSVILLKNTDDIIHDTRAETGAEKPSVYIPMKYTAATFFKPASFGPCVDVEIASEYFNVVTDTLSDTLTGPADAKGNPTACEADVIRASAEELANVDFALVQITSPANVQLTGKGLGGGWGYDEANDTWIPLSLQYRPYTADSFAVCTESIGGDMITSDNSGLYQDD